jgi:hypothetical protein
VRSIAAVVTVTFALAGLATLVGWGCATTRPTAEVDERPGDYVPDGGWENYRPGARRQGEPEPMRAATGPQPGLGPDTSVSPGNPLVH